MGVGVDLILGKPQDFEVSQWTRTDFEVEYIVANAPVLDFVMVQGVQVDVFELLYDHECDPKTKDPFYALDAFDFTPRGVYPNDEPKHHKVEPTLCKHGVSIRGKYTGLVPEGHQAGDKFKFIVGFKGTGR
jgi:hypothetical protein